MYKNPRLKHVKRIQMLSAGVFYEGLSRISDQINDQCNLLLETKKAKKRKKKTYSEMLNGVYAGISLASTLNSDPKEESRCECKTKYCKHYKSDFERFIEKHPEPIKPLNLANTTTSRPELRETEKEIMIENKINEICEYLKAL